jgi:glycosyltransferase involved in cell wall biosynthesis
VSVKGIRILRPSAEPSLVSAAVFDHLLLRHLGSQFQIHLAPFLEWYDSVFGVPNSHTPVWAAEAATRLTAVTREFDFLCPGFHCFPITPMLAHLRNLGQARVRFLLIAHAPGAYLIEWTLLCRLLRPGDLIVAPTQSAKEVIEFLCPDLTDYVRVIPHPIHRLPGQDRPKEHRVVSLSRITPEKLLHRQIEAMAVIRDGSAHPPNSRSSGHCGGRAPRIRRRMPVRSRSRYGGSG